MSYKLGRAISSGLMLEELYWSHVELFPMHFGGLPVQAVDDLIAILSHGGAGWLLVTLSCFERS
jgi:hypothetical protein